MAKIIPNSDETVLTLEGTPELSIPRDRHDRSAPALIGFDDKIIEFYARGMRTPDIQHHIRELYGLEISADLVSAITDSVLDEVAAWQARKLEPSYAIVFFDVLRVKIGDEGSVKNRAVCVAIGLGPSGHKHVLGLWIGRTEGVRFWRRMMNEIRNRGTQDILIAVIDSLEGFAEAITAVFPNTVVQTCIVHLIRQSMQFAYWQQRTCASRVVPTRRAYGGRIAVPTVQRACSDRLRRSAKSVRLCSGK
jgi:putative transposase